MRIAGVDALRGLAAVMVMLFHYTTRYDELFVHESPTLFSVPWGHLGVNLFFMISGFVIFMTLDKTKHPMDFVVSRFSRLYPVFWVAVWVTFGLTWLFGLPGKTVNALTACANMLMFHNLLGVKNVDSVYWTLEVELLFYAAMLALWTVGLLKRPHAACFIWISIRMLYLATAWIAGIDLPYVLSRFLILRYVPYFAIGITLYWIAKHARKAGWRDAMLLAYAFIAILVGEGIPRACVAIVLAALLYVAVIRPPAILRAPLMLWLGAISYPLYLLHENLGWASILLLENHGVDPNLAVIFAIATSLSLAALLHYKVEMPAMHAIRRRYRNRQNAAHGRPWRPIGWAGAIAGLLGSLLVLSFVVRPVNRAAPIGLSNMKSIQRPRTEPVPCRSADDPTPLVLLVLGQSNAGNHGAPTEHSPDVNVFLEGRCYRSHDPLPGATGTGGSIWPWFAAGASSWSPERKLIVALLAVESTEIAAWTESGPLQDHLSTVIASLLQARLVPDAVLWQQGEADAQLGTTAEDYEQRFVTLRESIRQSGISAPLFVARSTKCRGDGRGIINRAQARITRSQIGVRAGADTDSLNANLRIDDCHFNSEGLRAAAALWLSALDPLFRRHSAESRPPAHDVPQ